MENQHAKARGGERCPQRAGLARPRLLVVVVASVAVAAAVYWGRDVLVARFGKEKAIAREPAKGVVTTAINSHQPLDTLSPTGEVRPLPADPALEAVLSPTSRLDYRVRLQAINQLGEGLSPQQIEILGAFVRDSRLPEGLTPAQLRALKNDVLNLLALQAGGEAALAGLLRQVYADTAQDSALRDYALQHLAPLVEKNPGLGWSPHWNAVAGPDAALAATAMLHLTLADRAGQLTTAEHDTLTAAALKLAADPAQPETSRATALQVCGQLKRIEARAMAYDIARSDRTSMPLRIAAVATLGDLGGDAATRAYLTTLTTGPEKRLRVPAESALKRFSIN